MKILIIYHSEHHGNTEKVALAMRDAVDADIVKSGDLFLNNIDQLINKYEIIGFGSGIYSGKHHKNLLSITDRLPEKFGKKVFIFSTSGVDAFSHGYHGSLKNALKSKTIDIAGEFNCLGFDTALISSGINHGKPDENDLNNAVKFIKGLVGESLK